MISALLTCISSRQYSRFGDRSTGRGTFGGKFGARLRGLYGVRVRQCRYAVLLPNYFGQTCYNLSIISYFCNYLYMAVASAIIITAFLYFKTFAFIVFSPLSSEINDYDEMINDKQTITNN